MSTCVDERRLGVVSVFSRTELWMKGICASRCVKSRGCSTACDSTAAIWSRVILIALSGTVVPRVPFVRIKTPGLYSLSHRSAGESRGASSARGHSSSHGFSWILIRRGVEGYMGDADSYAWRRRHRTEAAAPLNVLVFKFVRRPPPGSGTRCACSDARPHVTLVLSVQSRRLARRPCRRCAGLR